MNYAKHGRFGDTKIRSVDGKPAHVNKTEANLLDMVGQTAEPLIKLMGSGSINPRTGLKEYHGPEGAGSWSGDYDYEGQTPQYAQLNNHKSADGQGNHRHTSGWNQGSPYDHVLYDINGDGNYYGSEDYMSFMGDAGGNYSADPFMMEGIDSKFWHQRWGSSGWDSGANYPTGPQLSNNPDLDYDTLKLMYERGELLPWAEKYHDISANELDMFFNPAHFGQDPEYDPFMDEYGTYDFAVEEAGTTLTDAQTDAYDIRSPQMRQLGIDKAEGLSALGKAESIKGVQSGFAGGGGTK